MDHWLRLATIVVTVIGVAVTVLQAVRSEARKRSEKHAERLDDHHERLAVLEEKVERVEDEQKLGRTRYHDLRDNLTRYIGDKITERVNEAKDALQRWRDK